MLRWCRTTITPLDGYARLQSYTVRHHASATILQQRPRIPARIQRHNRRIWELESSPAPPLARNLRRVSSKDTHRPTPTISFNSLHVQTHSSTSKGRGPTQKDKTRLTKLSDTQTKVNVMDQHPARQNVPESLNSTLEDVLSLSGRSKSDQVISVMTLDSMYTSAKEKGQLELFCASRLTELISLFGTISLGKDRAACKFHSTLIHNINESSAKVRWDKVLDVIQVKEKLGFKLNVKDQYWLLRCNLFTLGNGRGTSDSSSGHLVRKQLAQARARYMIIARATNEAEVHVPYFNALLKWPSPARVAEVVRHLCSILDNERCPDQRFSDLLWDVMLQQQFITPSVQHAILQTLSGRLSKYSGLALASVSLTGSNNGIHTVRPPSEQPLATSRLVALLAGCFFPRYSPPSTIPSIKQWAFQELENVCNDGLPIGVRWDNIILLAASVRASLPSMSENANTEGDSYLNWRTILLLNTLDNAVWSGQDDRASMSRNLRAILRSLWRSWKQNVTQDGAVPVLRTIVTAFLQLAGETSDKPLTEGCFRFCSENNLFDEGSVYEGPSKLPVLGLITAYVRAAILCGTSWPDILSELAKVGVEQSKSVIESILRQIIPDAPQEAYELYLLAYDSGINPSFRSLLALSKVLVSHKQWARLSKLLTISRFERKQREELVLYILDELRVRRISRIQPRFAKFLGRRVQEIYAAHAPPAQSYYSIRFFLSIAVMSQQPTPAITIVETIYKTTPSIFTVRFLLRLLRLLLLHGQYSLAARLFRTARQAPGTPAAIEDFRRKLTLGLTVGGAHRLARNVSDMRKSSRRKTISEGLIRAVRFRYRSPKRSNTYTLLKKLQKGSKRTYTKDAWHAIELFLKTKRYSLARKVFGQVSSYLDRKTKTIYGNMILHAPMLRLEHRNSRLVRFVIRTKDFLVEKYGFAPDRATVNIILKSVLKWRHLDSSQLKTLFDHLARQGFLSPNRWRQEVEAPFGTPFSSTTHHVSLPDLSPDVSFHKHARPLYKMFIKAFHIRDDHRAARRVVGIMKVEAALAQKEWEKRERARRLGLVKKKLRTTKKV